MNQDQSPATTPGFRPFPDNYGHNAVLIDAPHSLHHGKHCTMVEHTEHTAVVEIGGVGRLEFGLSALRPHWPGLEKRVRQTKKPPQFLAAAPQN